MRTWTAGHDGGGRVLTLTAIMIWVLITMLMVIMIPMERGEGHGALGTALAWLGVGRVPISILVIVMLLGVGWRRGFMAAVFMRAGDGVGGGAGYYAGGVYRKRFYDARCRAFYGAVCAAQ